MVRYALGTTLGVGSRVQALVECSGEGDDGRQLTLPPGALGTVDMIDLYDDDQGVVVTVAFDAGITNAFDYGDGPLGQSLRLVDERAASPVQANAEAMQLAREAAASACKSTGVGVTSSRLIREGFCDTSSEVQSALAAVLLLRNGASAQAPA